MKSTSADREVLLVTFQMANSLFKSELKSMQLELLDQLKLSKDEDFFASMHKVLLLLTQELKDKAILSRAKEE